MPTGQTPRSWVPFEVLGRTLKPNRPLFYVVYIPSVTDMKSSAPYSTTNKKKKEKEKGRKKKNVQVSVILNTLPLHSHLQPRLVIDVNVSDGVGTKGPPVCIVVGVPAGLLSEDP